MKTSFRLFTSFILILFLHACSSSDEAAGPEVTNGLSESYPTDLAITSPFAAENAVEGLVRDSARNQVEEETVDLVPYDQRREEIVDKLNGDGEAGCAFVFKLFRTAPPAGCYGPAITYSNHPDADGANTTGSLPSGDLGIWHESDANGNACVAAKINNLVGDVQAKVDTAIDLVTAMLCVAKVEDKDNLPSVGDSVDLKDELQKIVDVSTANGTVNLASILRETNTVDDDRPSYFNQLEAFLPKNDRAVTVDINLRHIPETDDNLAYRGRLWYTISGDLQIAGGGGCTDPGKGTYAFSISYAKSSDGTLAYTVQRADYCDEPTDPFNPDGTLDRGTKNGGAAPDPEGWVANFNEYRVELNTETQTGKLTFGWQAGAGDPNTRVFLAEFGENDQGNEAGCGFFGYGAPAETFDGTIDGVICNWAGPGNTKEIVQSAQKQCFAFDPVPEIFESTEAAISYAPVNDCETVSDPDAVFDGRTEIPDDLADLSEVNITPPISPEI